MIYKPREDTLLINKVLQDLANKNLIAKKKVLELGCGNCHNSIFCAKHGASVFSLDINPDALKYGLMHAKKESVVLNFVLSNMFQNLRETNFDIIIFNPPYLPSDKIEDITVDGLEKGRHFIDIFIHDFDKYLKKGGFALLLHTDYNDLLETEQKLKEKGFKIQILKRERYFFEELFVLKITKE